MKRLGLILIALITAPLLQAGFWNNLPDLVEENIPEAASCRKYQKARYKEGEVYVVHDLKLVVKAEDGLELLYTFPITCYRRINKAFQYVNLAKPEHAVLRKALVMADVEQPTFFGRRWTDLAEADLPELNEVADQWPEFDDTNSEHWRLLGHLYAERNQETDALSAFRNAQMFAPRDLQKWKSSDYRNNIPFAEQEAAAAAIRTCEPGVAGGHLWKLSRILPEMLKFEMGFADYVKKLLPMARRLPPFPEGTFTLDNIPSKGHDILCANPALKYILRMTVEANGTGQVRLYQPNEEGQLENSKPIKLQRLTTCGKVWADDVPRSKQIQAFFTRYSITPETPLLILEDNRVLFYPLKPNKDGAIALFTSLPPHPVIPLPLVDLRTLVGERIPNK